VYPSIQGSSFADEFVIVLECHQFRQLLARVFHREICKIADITESNKTNNIMQGRAIEILNDLNDLKNDRDEQTSM